MIFNIILTIIIVIITYLINIYDSNEQKILIPV